MKQTHNFVFLFVLFCTHKGKFVAYAKRASEQKADNILLKILSKNRKVMKVEKEPTLSMSREMFLGKRNLFLGKARQLNQEKKALQADKTEYVLTFVPFNQTGSKGGCYDNDSYLPESSLQLQTRLHPTRRPGAHLPQLQQ